MIVLNKVKALLLSSRVALLIILAMSVSVEMQSKTHQLVLPQKRVLISEVIAEIEKQTGLVVVANIESVDLGSYIFLSEKENSLNNVMQELLRDKEYSYQLTEKYLLIVPKRREPTFATSTEESLFQQRVVERRESYLKEIPQMEYITEYDTVERVVPFMGSLKYPAHTFTIKLDGVSRERLKESRPPLFAIKTNLLWAATLTPNLAAEIGLGRRTTIELSGGNNRWNLKGSDGDNKKLVHWIVKPEFRYWLCERFNGHFFGIHGLYAKYNVGGYKLPLLFDKEYRYEGDALGGGLSYGYHLLLSRRWGLEFNAGIGVARLNYQKKDCVKCGEKLGDFKKTYIGPTAIGLKVVFLIK